MKTVEELSSQERAVLADIRQRLAEAFPGVRIRYTLFGSCAATPTPNRTSTCSSNLTSNGSLSPTSARSAGLPARSRWLMVLSLLTVDRATARERGDFSVFANIKEEGIPL
ncbi:MAG: hypothetical protein C4293_16920 [Nitrospiraceae bacterium]